MIKGINRQILEVTNPESPYFDKILFFVSADGGAASEEKLRGEAKSIASQVKKPPKNRKSKKEIWLNAVYIACGIGAGAVLSLVFSALM